MLQPLGLGLLSSFEQVGHVIHLNLPVTHLPHRFIIGRILLDKIQAIRTVVNKMGNIASKFRAFKMELLAGVEDFNVTLKEHGITFRFDYSKVYWNSRLSTEHQRVLKHFKEGETIADMFAGVGPFALPAAARGFQVYANDLNPDSYAALVDNSNRNRLTSKIHAFNLDGSDFIQHLIRENVTFHHVLMNLPASAVEFMTAFRNTFPMTWGESLPMIHCYTFAFFEKDAEEGARNAQKLVEDVLGSPIEPVEIYDVRDVAPNKHMYCVSFPLPKQAAINRKRPLEDGDDSHNA